MSERRYNENELAEILRVAAKGQSASPSSGDESTGYSLAEIERLAAEVGIDPKQVVIAAQGLCATPQTTKGLRLFGGSERSVFERTISGTLDDIGWEDTVDELRNTLASAGAASAVGKTREWIGGSDFRIVHASLTPRNGQTKIRVTVNRRDTMAIAWILMVIVLIFTFIATLVSLRSNYGFFAIAEATVLVMVYLTIQRSLTKAHRKDLALVDRFINRVQELTTAESPNEIAARLKNELRTNA